MIGGTKRHFVTSIDWSIAGTIGDAHYQSSIGQCCKKLVLCSGILEVRRSGEGEEDMSTTSHCKACKYDIMTTQ